MNKTSIEWARNPDGGQGYTWNPITGCLNHINGLCKGGGFPCYAYKLANGRLKPLYLANQNIDKRLYSLDNVVDPLDPFYPRFWEERLEISHTRSFLRIRERQRYRDRGIFVCDMGELFGNWIPSYWQEQVFQQIKQCPNDRFYLLTKQPQNLITFSPFPDNCWVGVTVTGKQLDGFVYPLTQIKTKIKFISFEPLLDSCVKDVDSFSCSLENAGINWLIIGACTGNLPDMNLLAGRYPDLWLAGYKGKITAQPRIEWLQEIELAAKKAGIMIFEKDNLQPLLKRDLIQEVPCVK